MTDLQHLIDFAQNYLKTKPVDILHDYQHHLLVRENCREIIAIEKVAVDVPTLEAAAWWHDIEKTVHSTDSASSTLSFLTVSCNELNIDPSVVKKLVKIIGEHSFSHTQSLLESMVLYDADKIEYVNLDRLNRYLTDIDHSPEKYPQTGLRIQYQTWFERIQAVLPTLHFDWSRRKYDDLSGPMLLALERLHQKAST